MTAQKSRPGEKATNPNENSFESTSETAGTTVFQPMPDLTPDQYDALRADIAEHGVIVPIVIDQAGRILDGYNRAAIAAELGIDCPTETHVVQDDDDAADIAVTLNCARRHLNRDQVRHVIEHEINRRPNDSDRAIARRVGCSPSTVGSARNPKVSNLDTWEPPADVDRELRARVLGVYDEMNLPPQLPTTDADAERAEAILLQDADQTLAFSLALAAGADPLQIAVAVIGRMALWKSTGVDRGRIRRLFEPWLDLALSPTVQAEHTADETVTRLLPDAAELPEFVDVCLDSIASIPSSLEAGERDMLHRMIGGTR